MGSALRPQNHSKIYQKIFQINSVLDFPEIFKLDFSKILSEATNQITI